MEFNLDSTEEKIINATFKILHNEGYDKTTTKKIAKEAGVNEVTIFRKFDNKSNLVEITKEYYIQKFINRLEKIIEFDNNEEIDVYLRNNFNGVLDLPDDEFDIIKVALEEVRGVSSTKLLITQITDTILDKLEVFFNMQMDNGKIRKVDSKALGVMCVSVTFLSIVLWRVYNKSPSVETEHYADSFFDMLFNGILP